MSNEHPYAQLNLTIMGQTYSISSCIQPSKYSEIKLKISLIDRDPLTGTVCLQTKNNQNTNELKLNLPVVGGTVWLLTGGCNGPILRCIGIGMTMPADDVVVAEEESHCSSRDRLAAVDTAGCVGCGGGGGDC